MIFVEQPGAGDDPRSGAVLVNHIGYLSEQIFHRQPDPWLEAGVKRRVLSSQPGLTASRRTHTYLPANWSSAYGSRPGVGAAGE